MHELGSRIDQQQKELSTQIQQLENANKAIRDKDLQIKRMDLQLVEKENLLRQLKRDLDISSKK
jgi:hypothetical protein